MNRLLVVSDLIGADREHVQFLECLQALQLRDVVGEQREVRELCQLLEALDLLNQVE